MRREGNSTRSMPRWMRHASGLSLSMVALFLLGFYILGPALNERITRPIRIIPSESPGSPHSNPAATREPDETVSAVEVLSRSKSPSTVAKGKASQTAPLSVPSPPSEIMLPHDDKRVPPSESPDTGSTVAYRVQAGAFATREATEQMVDKLRSAGLEPTVITDESDGRLLYVVQVGIFRSRDNAEKAANAVRSAGVEVYIAEQE